VQQDDRVGVELALVLPGAQLREHLRGQGVPGGVGARVDAHEQAREGLVETSGSRSPSASL
jgi:hypothetical protein